MDLPLEAERPEHVNDFAALLGRDGLAGMNGIGPDGTEALNPNIQPYLLRTEFQGAVHLKRLRPMPR